MIILPVMIANTISYRISRRMQPDSLFHILGHQDGLDLPSVEEKREAPVLHVEDAMRKDGKRVAAAASATVDDALAGLDEDGASAILIDSGYGRWTWVSRRDLERVWREGWGAALIKDAFAAALGDSNLPRSSVGPGFAQARRVPGAAGSQPRQPELYGRDADVGGRSPHLRHPKEEVE